MTKSNVFNKTVKSKEDLLHGLTVQSREREISQRSETRWTILFSALIRLIRLLSWIYLQHASSLNRQDLLSKSACVSLPHSLCCRQWERQVLTSFRNTHTQIPILKRTLYRFPLIPWKITSSSNSDHNICSANKISFSIRRNVCSQSAGAGLFPASPGVQCLSDRI